MLDSEILKAHNLVISMFVHVQTLDHRVHKYATLNLMRETHTAHASRISIFHWRMALGSSVQNREKKFSCFWIFLRLNKKKYWNKAETI